MKRELDELHFDKASLPMPKDCYDALMNAAGSVKEEKQVRHFPFRAVIIAAIIVVSTMGIALAAQHLGWVDFYQKFQVEVPNAAVEALDASEPVSFEVGPMTFTYHQLLADRRIVLSSAEVHMTDGTKALIAADSDFDEPVDAVSDTVLRAYGLEPGTTWIETAEQLHLPLYGVRALVEIAPQYDSGTAMEDALWNESGSLVYYHMAYLNGDAVTENLPATLYMAVHQYDSARDEVSINAWTERKERSLDMAPLLAEKTYLPAQASDVTISLFDPACDENGEMTPTLRSKVSLTLQSVHAKQYATGIYFTADFTVNTEAAQSDISEALAQLSFCDAEGTGLPMGMSLARSVMFGSQRHQVSFEIMTSLDQMPEELMLGNDSTTLYVK